MSSTTNKRKCFRDCIIDAVDELEERLTRIESSSKEPSVATPPVPAPDMVIPIRLTRLKEENSRLRSRLKDRNIYVDELKDESRRYRKLLRETEKTRYQALCDLDRERDKVKDMENSSRFPLSTNEEAHAYFVSVIRPTPNHECLECNTAFYQPTHVSVHYGYHQTPGSFCTPLCMLRFFHNTTFEYKKRR